MPDQPMGQPVPTPRGNRYLVVHGHFYQPPRENPFLGEIEGEDSAYPHNDWNERITHECYRPLSASRLLDSNGRIEEIINCYRYINFNVGPTLLSWMDRHHPDLVAAIVAADQESRARNNGHGNAIAQVYNHIIMPLANNRDRRTQILWGLSDFRRRFGRESESIWLAETAINEEVLELLVEFGLKYVILSPYQVESIRDPRSGEWISVSNGSVDPRRPYLVKTKNGSITVFFYDGPLASAVSFEHLLRSADSFSARIIEAAGTPAGDEGVLVNVATDGEAYGHHEPFGDMCLSYALTRLIPNQGFTVTNYGNYLELHPPTWEAKIKKGPNGEGTAWSCAHGVGRWYRDCGCSTGAGPGWNQRWRTPLRESLNKLRDRLAEVYELEGKSLFEDPWRSRDEYIEVMQSEGLSYEAETRARFLDNHLKKGVDEEGRRKALCLLESQRNSLLMFTSCGWFFAEVSGIETVQIMKYAARAVDVISEWIDGGAERDFVVGIQDAVSNIPAQKDGAACYKKYILPLKKTDLRVANQVVHLHHLSDLEAGLVRQYSYDVELFLTNRVDREEEQIQGGCVALRDLRIDRKRFWRFVIARFGELRTHAFFVPIAEKDGPLFSDEELKQMELPELTTKVIEEMKGVELSLRDLIKRERMEVTNTVLFERTWRMRVGMGEIADKNEDLLELLVETKVPLPPTVKNLFEITLSASLVEGLDLPLEEALRRAQYVKNRTSELGLSLHKDQATLLLGQRINHAARRLREKFNDHQLSDIADFLELCELVDVHPDFVEAQEIVYQIVRSRGRDMAARLRDRFDAKDYQTLNLLLENAMNLNLNVEFEKKMIAFLERKLSEDPNLWP